MVLFQFFKQLQKCLDIIKIFVIIEIRNVAELHYLSGRKQKKARVAITMNEKCQDEEL